MLMSSRVESVRNPARKPGFVCSRKVSLNNGPEPATETQPGGATVRTVPRAFHEYVNGHNIGWNWPPPS